MDYSPNGILWRDLARVHRHTGELILACERLATIWRLAGGVAKPKALRKRVKGFPRMPASIARVLEGEYRPSTDASAIVEALGPGYPTRVYDAAQAVLRYEKICQKKHSRSCSIASSDVWAAAIDLSYAIVDLEDR